MTERWGNLRFRTMSSLYIFLPDYLPVKMSFCLLEEASWRQIFVTSSLNSSLIRYQVICNFLLTLFELNLFIMEGLRLGHFNFFFPLLFSPSNFQFVISAPMSVYTHDISWRKNSSKHDLNLTKGKSTH